MRPATQTVSSPANRRGFTIVELLIVIVVIGILAAVVIVAYNGIRARAEDASLQSEASQAGKKVLTYKALNSDALPTDATTAGIAAGSGRDVFYRLTPDGKNFCVAVNITGSPDRAYSFTSTNQASTKGTCQGYILVPGNSALGTSDFWAMKYEAKNVNNVALSQAASTPWVNISQTDAISTSTAACSGCHLISEAEWMTIAGNVIGVASNWSGGSVGSGYLFSGHNDNTPANARAADSNDANSYSGTGNTSGQTVVTNGVQGNAERRTLTLTNGEVIWDLAGNVFEYSANTATGGQPGASGYAWREWSAVAGTGSLATSPFPSSVYAGAVAWNSAQGLGLLYSNTSETGLRSLTRSGYWNSGGGAGVFGLSFGDVPSNALNYIGFRVAR